MERAQIDCVIVGAGVIGLACARRLAQAGREVLILEAEGEIGSGVSARNSEVIHAGLYYPTGSLKARLCVTGREMLYAYCAGHSVTARKVGKLVVATTSEQIPALHKLMEQAQANGVDDLALLSADDARRLEPELNCVAAFHSPSTGIIDTHGLMLSLLGQAETRGAALALHAPVERSWMEDDGRVTLAVGGAEPMQVTARLLVNAAGLGAQKIARNLRGYPADRIPPLYYAKGNYFSLSGRSPFSRLIYPMPEAAGLGVHLTLDLAGQARFGPDVEWIDQPQYDVAAKRGDAFYAAIRTYWPGLRDGTLQPAYAGIRPKIQPPGTPALDFRIDGPEVHGLSGQVHLYGIESPGLTSSLAIADEVAARLGLG
ncbi:NAD(P)/FAD-dependent oxidoreductase [Dongia deserti]|uniref:NAD(P)/FAD-dependent oxidoreductase n=1 Tax=Dongia deserti TaxID=2268030 RepID=UPI000E64E078|nr:NAD(P)/FAD-dependent oxidoreductase [Dongia deserti]